MEWKKTKITRWTAGNYRITEETSECDGRPYRLESCDTDTEYFATLEDAKATAKRFNEFDLLKADNERLRAELAQKNGVWPNVPPDDEENARIDAILAEDRAIDNGRGIPKR